jgi:hypothetical protein
MPRSKGWRIPLAAPLSTRDGQILTTLDEARDYALALPDGLQLRNEWQHAGALLMAAAESGTRTRAPAKWSSCSTHYSNLRSPVPLTRLSRMAQIDQRAALPEHVRT